MALDLSRRHALFGLLAAPVIIRTPGLLMPMKPLIQWRRGPLIEVVLRDGKISSCTIVNVGSGYVSPPYIELSSDDALLLPASYGPFTLCA